MHNQESVEAAYSCLTKNILQAVENTILKSSTGKREDHPLHAGIKNVKSNNTIGQSIENIDEIQLAKLN